MRLSQAETLCPQARFLPSDEAAYHVVHQALIDSARCFTPTVETDELGLVYADIAGLRRRFEDDTEAARGLIEQATSNLALDVQIGVACGKFVAQQAAQAAEPGKTCVVSFGEEQAFLSPLDISSLPFDPEMERRLRLLGICTLGTFAKLPRPAILRQFGSSVGPLYDLACGKDTRPVHASAPPLRLSRSHAFVNPVSNRKPLLAHIERIVDDLAEEIDRRGYHAEGLMLEIVEAYREERDVAHKVGKPVKPPSASADQLYRLGARMLGGLTIDGPAASLTLTVFPLRSFHHGAAQLALFGSTAISTRTSHITFGHVLRETLRRLRDRFGELSVLIASLVVAPEPSPIQATTDHTGLPRAIVWRERIWQVQSVYEHWRERRRWWGKPIERDYFRLEIENGRMKVIFRDVQANRWYVERRHI